MAREEKDAKTMPRRSYTLNGKPDIHLSMNNSICIPIIPESNFWLCDNYEYLAYTLFDHNNDDMISAIL